MEAYRHHKPADAKAFGFKNEEIAVLEMSVPCFLIAHPKGTLMWDVGVVPDSAFKGDGSPVSQGNPPVAITATKPLWGTG